MRGRAFPGCRLPIPLLLALAALVGLSGPQAAQEPAEAAAGRTSSAEGTRGIGAAADPGERSFTLRDAIGLVEVSDPRMSPDGEEVLFLRRELDWDDNERDRRIWIVAADGSGARPYTSEEGDGDPRWSPDGRWVAFTRDVDEEGGEETRQLFLLPTDGGEARRLTGHPTSVEGFQWGPEGRRIFFAAEDSLPDDEEERRDDGFDALYVNEGPNGQTRGQWRNLWWVEAELEAGKAEGVEARPLTEGERIVGDFAVAPGGDRVAFTYRTENHRNDAFRSEIALVDVETGEVRDLTDNEAPESDLAWSPDGSRLAFMAPDLETWRLDQGNLYVMDVDDRRVRQVAAGFPGTVRQYRWLPDGRGMVLSGLVRTDGALYRLDLASDETTRLTDPGGVAGRFTLSRAGDRIAFTFEAPTRPGDVYTVPLRPGAEPVRVTEANPGVEAKELAVPEVARWTSSDGEEIEGLLYRPPPAADTSGGAGSGGGSGPGALVLEIHGGPAGAFSRGFDADAQLLAAHGYAVLQPNVRGSTGYGDDFLRGNMEDIGGGDYEDLMTGVDAVLRRGVAHEDSLAVKGWSYGGILGGWTLTRTDRFRAASLGAMVADWPSEFGAGFHFDVARWYLGGDPWSNGEFWRERSAYTHMDRVETPTLLLHGAEDRVDTPGQSMNFHQALRHLGVPTRYVLFPREGHGIEEPRHQWTRLTEELRWFQRWVRGDEEWKPPEPEFGESGDEEDGEAEAGTAD